MRALLDDAAVLEHDDQVGVADRREAVRDHEGGAAGEQAAESPLDLALGADVHGRRGLVEDQDARVGEEARAKATSWRWPSERRVPRSPSCVS